LRSIPLHADDGQLQLRGLKALLQFHSTLDDLKDPPLGYLYPAVDLVGGLDTLGHRLSAGFYTNEYDFQVDIAQLIDSAHDGHLEYRPDLVSIFGFRRQDHSSPLSLLTLASISDDGIKLPSVYDWNDVSGLVSTNLSVTHAVSPIQLINGLDVEEALNVHATMRGMAQDPDANYNNLFVDIQVRAVPNNSFYGSFSSSLYYLGPETLLTFANGTEKRTANVAHMNPFHNLTNVTDGASFFEYCCTTDISDVLSPAASPSNATSSITAANNTVVSTTPFNSTTATKASNTTVTTMSSTTQVPYTPIPTGQNFTQVTGYPKPLVKAADQSIAGYLLNAQSDLAVISVPSFWPEALDVVSFENIVRETLATAASLGKKKLIIDLRSNGGGLISLGYDMFKQLFPSSTPTSYMNVRAHSVYDWWGQVTSQHYSNTNVSNATTATHLKTEASFAGPWEINFREATGAYGRHFNSWAEFYGPHVHRNGSFTSLFEHDFTDTYQTGDESIYGYQNDTAYQPQTFAANDIVLLQDGACASTCTIFSELMKNIMGVKTVVVGGRKQNGPMQGMGSVKGASSQSVWHMRDGLEDAYNNFATPAQRAAFDTTLDGKAWFNSTMHAVNRAVYLDGHNGGVAGSLNYQNNIRPGDETVTPLQFVYEAADCRFFYTAEMYEQQELVWKRAYDLMWGNATCVPGSTGHASTRNLTGVEELVAPPPNAKNHNVTKT